MNNFIESLTGVKPPFSQAALFEIVAALIFLIDLFWPYLSLRQLIRGLLVGGVWAVYGFIVYLKSIPQRPS
ncbi:hypothetical protein [Sulfobacillus thermosulfidooxidans]|uniref:hypothetical protein n=1 Tax=Sulfobacillus thermosulfidooxidans TaxID=28034 RepID=UPI0006B4BD42|nr:hypothetical protein [Sulfobacillus thermosulfidooxidans]